MLIPSTSAYTLNILFCSEGHLPIKQPILIQSLYCLSPHHAL